MYIYNMYEYICMYTFLFKDECTYVYVHTG